MNKYKLIKLFIAVLGLAFVISVIVAMLPAEMRTRPTSASQGAEITQTCPAPTDKGVYFERGFDKSTGELICGFSFYNACPYSEGVSADDPMCEKAKPTEEQLKPWDPNATTTVTEQQNNSCNCTCGSK